MMEPKWILFFAVLIACSEFVLIVVSCDGYMIMRTFGLMSASDAMGVVVLIFIVCHILAVILPVKEPMVVN